MLERVWKKGNPLTLLMGTYIGSNHDGEHYRDCLKNEDRKKKKRTKIELLAFPLLGIQAEKTENSNSKDICTSTFTAALFTLAKTWEQPKHPSTDHWFKKMLCI